MASDHSVVAHAAKRLKMVHLEEVSNGSGRIKLKVAKSLVIYLETRISTVPIMLHRGWALCGYR